MRCELEYLYLPLTCIIVCFTVVTNCICLDSKETTCLCNLSTYHQSCSTVFNLLKLYGLLPRRTNSHYITILSAVSYNDHYSVRYTVNGERQFRKQDFLSNEGGPPANMCSYALWPFYLCGLDLDPKTLTYDCDQSIVKTYLHTKMKFLGKG